jgi:hypothetical protein
MSEAIVLLPYMSLCRGREVCSALKYRWQYVWTIRTAAKLNARTGVWTTRTAAKLNARTGVWTIRTAAKLNARTGVWTIRNM